jgi:integrase
MAINILKAEQVKALSYSDAKKSLNDGGGLRLLVKPNSTKVWEFKYTFEGIRRVTSFGSYPNVSLAGARAKAKQFKELIEKNINPIEQNKEVRQKQKEEQLKKEHTIEKIVNDYLELKQHNKKLKDITIAKAKGRLENHFYNELTPYKNKTVIHNITFEKIVNLLKKIEDENKLETLFRVKILIIEIFKYAYTEGIIKDTDIFAKLELKNFKTQSKADRQNNPTLTKQDDIKKLYSDILNYNFGVLTKYALLMSIHTAQRQGSIITAKWCDINLDDKLWIIPASQMKMKKEHILPLSNQLVKYLKELKQMGISNNYLFPNTQHLNAHMSNNTVNHALRKMGFTKEEQTAHGMRAMFKTVCKENQEEHNLKNEFVERVLAHKTAGNVEEAYNRADNIKEMRFIVNWWSDYLENLISDEVKK